MAAVEESVDWPGLLLCEGPDDAAFFRSMLAHLSIDRTVVHVEMLQGRRQLHDRLNGLPLRDSGRMLRALAVVCDADAPDDGMAAFGRVRDSLRANGFTPPSAPSEIARGRWDGGPALSVSVYIMPDNLVTGALEDLCLSAINEDPSLPCVDDFLACVSTTVGIAWRPQDRAKARLNSWLASRPDPTLLLGHAMNANQINRGHAAFGPIRDFLTRLAAAASAPDPSPA